jgi:hypothetical protein
MPCREKVVDPARETSRVHCPRVRVVVTVSDRAVDERMLVAQANPAIAPTIVCQAKAIARTLAALGNPVTGRATLVDLVRLAIGQPISADRGLRAIGPATLAARDGRATLAVLATSVAPAL